MTTLADRIHSYGKETCKPFSLAELNCVFEDQKSSTIRGRIYDNLGKYFKRVSKGVYISIGTESCALVVKGNGRDLSEIEDESIHAIVTDHPWDDKKSNVGSGRNFIQAYEDNCFKYTQEDFDEKFRVIVQGGFLVENLPDENENNFNYLYEIKQMALKAGFKYFAQVPWKKGKLIRNTGRKSKNCEMLMFFSKGKPRRLRFDKQRTLKKGEESFMSGTTKMLPCEFNYQPKSPKSKRHPAEKPVELLQDIITHVSLKGEIILDQFSGSMNVVLASIRENRNVIAYELDSDHVETGLKSLGINFKKIK